MNTDDIQLIVESVTLQKKKGRPRKTPLIEKVEGEPKIKNKRGRKKKEKVEDEEIKQKKKRGRKAAVRYLSNSLRKNIPLTTIITDNEISILHLDIKDNDNQNDNNNQNQNDNITHGTSSKKDRCLYNSVENFNYNYTDIDTTKLGDSVIEEFIDNDNDISTLDIKELYENRLKSRIEQDKNLLDCIDDSEDNNLLQKIIKDVNTNNCNINNKTHAHVNCNNVINTTCSSIIEKSNSVAVAVAVAVAVPVVLVNNKGVYTILEKFIENKNWLNKTDVCCWWCCHNFDTIPIGLPKDYKNKKFKVEGVFCTFACMLSYAYNHESISKKNKEFKYLFNFMYKKLTGGVLLSKEEYVTDMNRILSLDLFDINDTKNAAFLKFEYIKGLSSLIDECFESAPPRCVLKMFGGNMSIETFRNLSKERKVCQMIEYPMYVCRNYLEEIDLEKIKNKNSDMFKNKYIDNSTHNNQIKYSSIKIEEAKTRIDTNRVISNNSINKFLK